MDGATLKRILQEILPAWLIRQKAKDLGVIQRIRKRDVVKLAESLELNAGSDDSGVLADVHRRYCEEAEETVVRGAFYDWMDEEMVLLMEALLVYAMDYAAAQPVHLPEILGTVKDWRLFDSETITLRDELQEVYPGSGSPAAVKVHKELSVGRCCMTYCHFGPAKEHVAPNFEVNERYRDHGLLVDLGYASRDFIQACKEHRFKYVIRLKDNWKPKVKRIHRGEVNAEFLPGTDLDVLIEQDILLLDGRCVDATVGIGQGAGAVDARLVMIPGPDGYLAYLTNLDRGTHGPHQVGDLYRVRWEIETDNKLDTPNHFVGAAECAESGARLDQIRSTTQSSVSIQICAALLHSMVVNVIIHRDMLDRVEKQDIRRAPLHRLLLAKSIRQHHAKIFEALCAKGSSLRRREKLAELINSEGRDPN